jgi:hypothetical protein
MRRTAEQVIARLRAGDRIMVTHPDPLKVSERTTYALVEDGGGLTATMFRRLAEELEPVQDGLFPDQPSQTYRLRPE